MILIAELQMDRFAHFKFNKGLIAAVAAAGKDILFFGGREQGQLLSKDLKKSGFGKWLTVQAVNNGYCRSSRLLKEIYSLFAIFRLIRAIRLHKVQTVFITSASPYAKMILLILNKFLRKKIIIVFHGELEGLKYKSILPFSQSFWTSRFLNTVNGNTYALMISTRVYSNAASVLSQKSCSNIISYIHPYIFEKHHASKPDKTPLLFSMTGVASGQKGADKMFLLSEYLEKAIASGTIALSFSGTVEHDIRQISNGRVSYGTGSGLIDSSEYRKRISSCTAILMFYNESSYSLTPSGALFDILDYERPVIALDSPLMREFFDQYGNLGILCRDTAAMAAAVKRIISGREDITPYKKAIKHAKRVWTVKKYSHALLTALGEKGIIIT